MSGVGSAIERYHSLIEHEPALAETSAEMLQREQPKRRLMFGEKPLCSVLRPQFFTPDTYREIQRVCRVLSGAMFRLSEYAMHEPQLLDALHLTAEERELAAIDPGFRPPLPTTRLDSFMAGELWHFVEYNAETPAAIAYEDLLGSLFLELPVIKRFAERFELTPTATSRSLSNALLDAFHQWGGRNTPTIAVVDWAGLPTASEHVMFCEHFGDCGLRGVIAQPGDLEYDGSRLHAGGTPVDIVYRRVLTSELLAKPDEAKALLDAYRDGNVCVVNSFRSKLLHKKAIFALLSDDRYSAYFSEQERDVIDTHVPWTRNVNPVRTSYGGTSVDLLDLAERERERFVLKPNDEYGGKGVVIGWESTAEQWREALSDALETPSVIQERVPVDRDLFPMWISGRLEWHELSADLDPFLFGTEVQGVLVRLSADALLNVTAGTGSLAPAFIIREK